jgi:hypothetical protein
MKGFVCALLIVAGCSGASPEEERDQACGAYASQLCRLLQKCGPVAFDGFWGDQATCAEGWTAQCKTVLGAPGSGENPATKSACADALTSLSCENSLPAACSPRAGMLANMAPCRYAEQCQSQRCAMDPGSLCGKCAPLLPEGLRCNTDTDCATSLECSLGICRPIRRGAEGHVCSAVASCREPLACKGLGQEPASEGVCAARDPNDRTCGVGASFMDCDASQGLVCETTNQCVQFTPMPKVGEACLHDQYCNGSGVCTGKKCAPIPRAGERCQQQCLFPAICGNVIDSSGTSRDQCVIPDPSFCK